jgi:elongation factor Ts
VLFEINCETDFVARGEDFTAFAADVVKTTLAGKAGDVDAVLALKLGSGATVDESRRALIAKIGENISLRRFVRVESPSLLGSYLHGTRIGTLVALDGGDAALARDLAMHVAASNPRYLSAAEVPPAVIAKEREILLGQAATEGKPPEIAAKMVEGRLRKQLAEITLAGQPFIKDPDTTIEKLLLGAKARVLRFERLEVGAGIEKKKDDFVAEVMAQAKGTDPNSTDPAKKH